MIPSVDAIRAKNIANILTKLKEGKILSEREQRMIAEYQEEQSQTSSLDKVWKNGVTNNALVEHWGVVKSYLSKLRKEKQMPVFSTLREADLWRAQNAPPVVRRQNAAIQARKTPEEETQSGNFGPAATSMPDFSEAISENKSECFDELMLQQAEGAVKMAWWLLEEAVKKRDHAAVAFANKNWSEAAKQAGTVRERFLTLKEKNGELLHLDLVMNIVGNTLGGIRSGLARLPGRCAAAANPENPELAQREIEREIDRLLELVHPAADRIEQELIATAEIEKPSPTPDNEQKEKENEQQR